MSWVLFGCALTAAVVLTLLAMVLVSQLALFGDILRAKAWHDFRRVLWVTWLMQRHPAVRKAPLVRYVVERERALALASVGRLDEALSLFEAAIKPMRLTEAEAELGRGALCLASGQVDRGLAHRRRAFELDTQHACDLVYSLLRHGGPVEEARRALEAREPVAPSRYEEAHRNAAWALVLVEEERWGEALQRLEVAGPMFVETGKSQPHLLAASRAEIDGYRALCLAHLGQVSRARQVLSSCARRLAALNEDRLLERCRKALSGAAMRDARS